MYLQSYNWYNLVSRYSCLHARCCVCVTREQIAVLDISACDNSHRSQCGMVDVRRGLDERENDGYKKIKIFFGCSRI